ncbi:hypothetical protein D3C80_406670 [compost metagenome]
MAGSEQHGARGHSAHQDIDAAVDTQRIEIRKHEGQGSPGDAADQGAQGHQAKTVVRLQFVQAAAFYCGAYGKTPDNCCQCGNAPDDGKSCYAAIDRAH